MTRTIRSKRAEEQTGKIPLVCPRCAGNKQVMDFRSGDRTTGEPAGWKATLCPGCGGIGSVDEKTAAAILAEMEQDSPANAVNIA